MAQPPRFSDRRGTSDRAARIQLVEVYPDGSRARLLETPRAVITPSTRAEIDIPVSGLGFAYPKQVPVDTIFGGSEFEATPEIEPPLPEPDQAPSWEPDPAEPDHLPQQPVPEDALPWQN